MAIPDFQSIMFPLLRLVADRQVWKLRDVVDQLADQYQLSDQERSELLPSGRAPLFYNRVAWAKTYLAKASALESVSRGLLRITDRGMTLLSAGAEALTVKGLIQYTELTTDQQGSDSESIQTNKISSVSAIPPQEQLEQAYNTLLVTLIDDLVVILKGTTPARFEQIVVDVLTAMGYGGNRQEAGRTVGKTGDGGIDGIINEDRLGLDAIYIQAKRWANDVGAGEIRDFKGALDGHGAAKGVFITTAGFTKAALDEVSRSRNYKIILIDGAKLARFMIEYKVGVSTAATYELKKIDSDYFADE